MDGVVFVEEFVGATCLVGYVVLTVVVEQANWFDGFSTHSDSDGVGTRIMQLDHDELGIVSV